MLKPICAGSALIMSIVFALLAMPIVAVANDAVPVPDNRNFATVMRGARLFQQNCAACHGKQADGAPAGWAASSIPPALNGNAHTWHHPTRDLLQIISAGTVARGGGMPAWGGILNQQQMVDIISWLHSKWPEEKYQQWLKTDKSQRRH